MSALRFAQFSKVILVSSLFLTAGWARANQTAELHQYDQSRVEAMAQAESEMELLDLATPAELQELFGLAPELEGQMHREIPQLFSTATYAVEIQVSIARQTLDISFPWGHFSTRISSARRGYHTITGCFTHPHLEAMHYSRKYHNSPMPHSMFFYGGYAIHGTLEESELGHPASHGCVRVSRADAAYLYDIVEQAGPAQTRICVH